MLQSCGDEDAAREQLYLAVLQPFVDRVWQGEGAAGPGEGERASASRTLLQMTMAESSCQSVATSIITHTDFQQIVMDKNVDRDVREKWSFFSLLVLRLLLLILFLLCHFLLSAFCA